MNTTNNTFLEKCLYCPISNVLVYKPLLIWANANRQLEKKYQEADVNLTNSPEDIKIKNTARHVTGLGLAASQYGYMAYPIGIIKEGVDLFKDFFREPIWHISPETKADSLADLGHNNVGIQYVLNNPNISCDELMDFAISFAKEEQQYMQSQDDAVG